MGKLKSEDSKYHQKYILLLDNATYHKTADVQCHMKLMGFDVIYLGPYSWLGAPAELLFSALKREDLNPDHLPSGKE